MRAIRYILFIFIVIGYQQVFAADLSQLQKQIKQQEIKVAEKRKKRAMLQSTLKNQEMEMNGVINKLKKTEMSLNEIRQAIRKTEQQIKQLEKQETFQKQNLTKQLDSAYRSGVHPSMLEKLLSNEAKDADRMLVYYGHLNQIRVDIIQELRKTQEKLKAERDVLQGQQKDHHTQLSKQKEQEKNLQKVKNERESTLRSLNQTLDKDESRLEELRNNENALKRQIERATVAAAQREKQAIEKLAKKKIEEEKRTNKPYKPTEQEQQSVRIGSGLGSPNKQYRMPVNGKITTSFGANLGGELRAKGVTIQASMGAEVRAIADGKVILSDWLQGYGQVVAIDHGKGDMSLYGYNQSVSVKLNDRVKAGQAIASVGNSGGQNRSALYFEIRRKGNAVNPLNWVK